MTDQSQSSGCGRFLGTLIGTSLSGCLMPIIGVLVGGAIVLALLIFGLNQLSSPTLSLFNNMLGIFNTPPLAIQVPETVYIPEVEPIQAIAQLTTTRYNYSKLVTIQQEMPGVLATLYGDGLAMVAVGHIQAGIDISELTDEDITYDPESRTLTLIIPAPRLLECFLNEQLSYVVTRQSGIFASRLPNLEVSARRFAIQQFRDMAIEEGIYLNAAQETEGILREFLRSVVSEGVNIAITIEPQDPNAELPQTCR